MTDETTAHEQTVARTWEDEEFKQELLSKPKAVIEPKAGSLGCC